MSRVGCIAAEDQTVVVLAEDDYVALLVFFGSTTAEELDLPDSVVLLDAGDAVRLADALNESAARLSAAA